MLRIDHTVMIRKNNYNWGIAIVFLLACNSSFAQVKLGDNLGTHSANKALVMNGNDINSVRVINAEGMVIGTASMVDNASIALQVNASDKAILLPRVTDLLNTTSPSIANPVEGMIVYDLATHKFYIRNNNTWTTYLTTTLAEGHILVGDANGMPQPVAVSGDVNLQSTGEMTVGNLKITNAKLANGSVDNAKLLADAVTTDKIVNLAVTAGKVGSGAGVNKVLTTDNTGNNIWVDRSQFASTTLNSGQILLGNSANVATAVVPSGDVTITDAGVTVIGTGKVQTGMLAGNAVISSKILDANVTGAKLASDAVTSDKIKDLEVSTADLANAAVTEVKIAPDAVTTVKIANANVTAAKLANAPAGGDLFNKVLTTDASGNNTWADKTKITLPAMTDKQVIVANGTTPAAVTMSGDATIGNTGAITIATGAVNSAKIADGTVTGTDIATGTVTSANILDATIAAADIASDAVTTNKILNDNVTEAKIASDAVTTAKIANANVTAAKLANAPAGGDLFDKVLTTDASGANTWADKTKITLPAMTDKQVIVANGTTPAAVTMSGDATIGNTGAITIAAGAVNSAKIADGTVTGTDIATGTVTSTNILDATIASADIANNAITTVKIANANVTSAKLANAPAGGDLFNKVLTTDASGNNTWADKTKITLPAMTDMQVIVASGTIPAAVTMSGDASISNTGSLTIATAAVNSAKIADGTVTGTDIASGTVTSDNILDATIAAADIASNAVTTNKILNGNVTVNKLGTAGISDADKIYTTDAAGKPTLVSSLSAAKIANGTVSDTEYQTLDGVTSGIQNQLDAISVGLVPVGSVTAWFPNLLSSATLPANFVECNGQVISDAQSPLDGVTIPNLNGGSYLTGTTGTTGTSVGSNSLTLTMANLPNTTISGTSSAVSAGTPAGTISVATAGAHTHTMTPVTSLYGDDIGNTNGGDGQAIRVEETNSAGAHTHTATFTGTAMATHSHTTNINLNGGVTQTAINNRPQSFTVRWIMRIK